MKRLIMSLSLLFLPSYLWAAVGCTLNDPDRDIRRIFPEATNYKTEFIAIADLADAELKIKQIQDKLGDRLEPIYESVDVPYAYYTVIRKKEIIGYVHGVNQKGMYGGMQLILATDLEGSIIEFYYQKISSPEAKTFRNEKFTNQFIHLTINEFLNTELKIKDPSKESRDDFLATIRGLKKNLILFQMLKLENNLKKGNK